MGEYFNARPHDERKGINMKKLFALVLALAMALALVACGGGSSSGSGSAAPAASESSSAAPAAAAGGTVKIGVFEPQTGDNGAGGKQESLGRQYAN